MLEFILTIAIITSTPCGLTYVDGCVYFSNGWQSTGTIYLKSHKNFITPGRVSSYTAYHEYGHFLYQKYFPNKFWRDSEQMADMFAHLQSHEKINKKYVNWFNQYKTGK